MALGGEADLPLGVRTVPAEGEGWIHALPGLETAAAGTRITIVHDAPDSDLTLVDGAIGQEDGDPERPAWRIGGLRLSHARQIGAFEILEVASPDRSLGRNGAALLELLRRARSLTPDDARRAPACSDPRGDLYRQLHFASANTSDVEAALGYAQRITRACFDWPNGDTDLGLIVENAAAATVADAPDASRRPLLDDWAALGDVQPHPDPWAGPWPRDTLFDLWATTLRVAPLITLEQPSARADLVLLWPLGYEQEASLPWLRLTGAYPRRGAVLPPETRLRHDDALTYRVVGTDWRVDMLNLEYGPARYALVAPDEPLLDHPAIARRLYEQMTAFVSDSGSRVWE